MNTGSRWLLVAVFGPLTVLAHGCYQAPELPITVSDTARPGVLFSSPQPYELPFSVDDASTVYINFQDNFANSASTVGLTVGPDYFREIRGSFSEVLSLPSAGNYELVIDCLNSFDPCSFTATVTLTAPLVYDSGQEIESDGVYQAPFTLSAPAPVRYWLRDNFSLTANGWRVAIVSAADVDAFVSGAEPTAYGAFVGMGRTDANVELMAGDYALVVACTNLTDPCRFDALVAVDE